MAEALERVGWTHNGVPDYTFSDDNFPEGWWHDWLCAQRREPYFDLISANIAASHKQLENDRAIYPPKSQVFRAFASGEAPSVVILGQDPYHSPDAAVGLCFSVSRKVRRPPSLLNIYKELVRDPEIPLDTAPAHGDLGSWASQNVMMLNTALTVRESKAGSHLSFGWETLTDNVIRHLNSHAMNVVFLLWGKHAQAYANLIDQSRHHVLVAGHPSPLNRRNPFVGCGHFSRTNELLLAAGRAPIRWESVGE